MAQKGDSCGPKWETAAQLMNGDRPSLGFAGMIAGVYKDALIIAGGANFPETLPWQGGKKYYSNEIRVLEKSKTGYTWNSRVKTCLPFPIAYAGSANTGKGLFWAGGENANGISAKAGLLAWNSSRQEVEVKPLPDLPVAVTSPAVTSHGNTVYLFCGDEATSSSARAFCMDLDAAEPAWKSLTDAPLALANGLAVFQNGKICLIGGRTKTPSGISELHATTFVYDIKNKKWTRAADIFDGKKITPFTAGAAFAQGTNKILVAGGDKGDIFHQIEIFVLEAGATSDSEKKQKILNEKNRLVEHHQGFSTDILEYDITRNKWRKAGSLPVAAQVTTAATTWGKHMVICSGEIRPGVRSPKILIGTR